MKRKMFFVFFVVVLVITTTSIYAMDMQVDSGYTFNVNYSGNLIEEEMKEGIVTLEGKNATPYTNVQIKVEIITAPEKPTILATDSQGKTFDIVELGAWGPSSGFAVGGTFKNETPVKATFHKAGTYVMRLSLVDKTKSDKVIISQEFTQTVYKSNPAENQIENGTANEIVNNTVEEIPQTGVSIWTYVVIILAIAVAIYLACIFIKRKR